MLCFHKILCLISDVYLQFVVCMLLSQNATFATKNSLQIHPDIPTVIPHNASKNIPITTATIAPIIPVVQTNLRTKSALYKWPNFNINLDDAERNRKFSNNPYIYAVLMGKKNGDLRDTILSFTVLDCSVFNVENGTIMSRSQAVHGIIFEMYISIQKAFLSRDEILLNEPIFINIEK